MNIYCGNLPKDLNDNELSDLFTEFGAIKSAKVIKDMFSGESKGFGFVEMNDAAESQKAIDALNGREVKGRRIVVNEARPKTDDRRSGPRSGGGGRGGNSRGGSGGGGFRGGNGGGGGKRW
ncbi:hypothetical protein BROC_01401 [Candidatus Brocadiaceae bacterium]|nr:hypothetical protein BROC_01401 [Candidatus Brocadiaceae bacterium]